jgi:hypothetical protein
MGVTFLTRTHNCVRCDQQLATREVSTDEGRSWTPLCSFCEEVVYNLYRREHPGHEQHQEQHQNPHVGGTGRDQEVQGPLPERGREV